MNPLMQIHNRVATQIPSTATVGAADKDSARNCEEITEVQPYPLSGSAGESVRVLERVVRKGVPARRAQRVTRDAIRMCHREAMHELGTARMPIEAQRLYP